MGSCFSSQSQPINKPIIVKQVIRRQNLYYIIVLYCIFTNELQHCRASIGGQSRASVRRIAALAPCLMVIRFSKIMTAMPPTTTPILIATVVQLLRQSPCLNRYTTPLFMTHQLHIMSCLRLRLFCKYSIG